MRQTRFRGKSLTNGKWVCGDSIKHTENASENGTDVLTYIGSRVPDARKVGAMKWVPVATSTIGQFTGLCDRNGKEIYEGDILRLGNSKSGICEVKWNEQVAAFCIRFYFEQSLGIRPLGAWNECEHSIIVIDNIHDNPELMDNEQSKS